METHRLKPVLLSANLWEEFVDQKQLREHLLSLLSGGNAHVDEKATFRGIPGKLRAVRPPGLPYSMFC